MNDELIRFVRERFSALADARKAREMAAYMKTEMPFYGIPKPDRVPVYREIKKRFPVGNQREYKAAVLSLWSQPHREEKYAAVFIAQAWPRFIAPGMLPLYRRLIVEGAWWDFVDDVAIRLVGMVMLDHRESTSGVMDRWMNDSNMWIRRSAIICQIKHKDQTDERRLFDYCRRRMHGKEFFIRKAIGWSLRAYAYTNPRAVNRFLREHRANLSGLSFREAAKHLDI